MPIGHHFPWGPFDSLVPNAAFFRSFTRIEQYCKKKRSQGVWISFLPLSFVFSVSPFEERCKLPPVLPKLLNFWDAVSSPRRVRNQIVHRQKSQNRQRSSFNVWWEEETCKQRIRKTNGMRLSLPCREDSLGDLSLRCFLSAGFWSGPDRGAVPITQVAS